METYDKPRKKKNAATRIAATVKSLTLPIILDGRVGVNKKDETSPSAFRPINKGVVAQLRK